MTNRTFRIARNPDADSTLPYLLWVPLGSTPLVLKSKETWPRTAKVYCHRGHWPDDAEVVEETPVRSCVRRGVAIDLVLDRYRENRSQFVITTLKGGREGIFWQTSKTTRKTRPGMRLPTRSSAAGVLEIVVDTRERYAWKFERQQVTLSKRALVVGDYAVEIYGETVGYTAAVDALSAADPAWLDALITRRVALDQWATALDKRPDDVKVVLEIGGAAFLTSDVR